MRSEIVARAKKQMRARMKALRGGHSVASLALRSERIVERLLSLPQMEKARSVASFWPMLGSGEVELRPLDRVLRARGVEIFYPFMDPRPGGSFATGFRFTASTDEMFDRGQRFFEPDPTARVAQAGDVDLVLVPALAADTRGHRIGYGAGYYDATLGDLCPPAESVIVAYQFQMMAELPTEEHDVAGSFVVTDENVYQV